MGGFRRRDLWSGGGFVDVAADSQMQQWVDAGNAVRGLGCNGGFMDAAVGRFGMWQGFGLVGYWEFVVALLGREGCIL